MKTEKDLLDYLDTLSIKYQMFRHEALFTCEQSAAANKIIPQAHTKNLFLKDDKKQIWLVSALQDTKIDLKQLSQIIDAPKLRFADQNLLLHYLGVLPGSVTAYGLINDEKREVNFILDRAILSHNQVSFHPLVNTATITVSVPDFIKFLKSLCIKSQVIDFRTYNIESI